ncbi:MAG: energy-coupling factor transporter transmembrane component T [Candidatus Eisenbacteria bacterium]
MINTFAQIDYLASAGRSPWHRASAISKMGLTLLFVVLAVFTASWGTLLGLLATSLLLCFSARLPVALIGAAAATPVLFSAVFVFAHWTGDRVEPFVLLMRPMISSLTAMWLVGTTPYPDLFAPLSRVLPRVVGDSLFLTYRAVFALLERMERLWKALSLRGAMTGSPARRAGMMGEAVGTLVLSGFDRSHRLYQTMLLRGHSGRICGCRHYLAPTREDRWVLATALWVVALAVVLGGWRPA